MNILITGPSGFIGRNLKEKYTDYTPKDWTIYTPSINLLHEGSFSDYVSYYQIDTIIHCAVSQDFYQNMQMLINVCEQPVKRIITFGSGCQYYPYPKAPKYKLFKEIQSQIVKSDSRMINLILYGVYGKYEDMEHTFISRSIIRTLKGLPIEIYQDRLIDYTYIDSLTEKVDQIIRFEGKEQEFHIYSGAYYLSKIAKIISKEKYIIKEKGRAPAYICKKTTGGVLDYAGFLTPIEEGIKKLTQYYAGLFPNGSN